MQKNLWEQIKNESSFPMVCGNVVVKKDEIVSWSNQTLNQSKTTYLFG